jgi:HAD superfamily hydrolase (TIGR01490 family)
LPLSVFDLDRTLLRKNSSFEFCKYLYKKKVFDLSFILHSCLYHIRHKFLGLSLEQLHHKVFQRLLNGRCFHLLASHVPQFIETYLEDLLYYPAIQKLRLAQHLGHYTMILSNAPSFIVKEISERLGVNEWRASEYQVDKDARLCQISLILQGKEKAKCVRDISKKLCIPKQDITAYSDSFYDLPFLQCAGTAIVVNPDRKLQKYSLKLDWEEI